MDSEVLNTNPIVVMKNLIDKNHKHYGLVEIYKHDMILK